MMGQRTRSETACAVETYLAPQSAHNPLPNILNHRLDLGLHLALLASFRLGLLAFRFAQEGGGARCREDEERDERGESEVEVEELGLGLCVRESSAKCTTDAGKSKDDGKSPRSTSRANHPLQTESKPPHGPAWRPATFSPLPSPSPCPPPQLHYPPDLSSTTRAPRPPRRQ